MKVLYGVQGTGNGHITRARVMSKYLAEKSIDVTYLFSGREKSQFFEMECFGDFLHRDGFTFITQAGQVNYLKTALHNNIFRFIHDVRQLELDQYDLIISDFEPVTSWAAKLQSKPVLGLGHQYAFHHQVPIDGANCLATTIMKNFAPATVSVGLHWHHFGQRILPPIIDNHLQSEDNEDGHILVYLPFEDQSIVTELLSACPEKHFVQYSPELENAEQGNVSLRKTSHTGFKKDLARASAVICNAGFELVSECLNMGLPLLVKPLHKQMEQISNAAALVQLGYASSTQQLDKEIIRNWIDSDKQAPNISIPNVGKTLSEWIYQGKLDNVDALCEQLWTDYPTNESDKPAVVSN